MVISNTTLDILARSSAAIAEFPMLKTLKAKPKKCCNKSVDHSRYYNSIKLSFSGMSPTRVEVLKKLLKTDKIELYIQQPGGKVSHIVK